MKAIDLYKGGIISDSELWQSYFDGEVTMKDIEDLYEEEFKRRVDKNTREVIDKLSLPDNIKEYIKNQLEL